MNDVMHWFPIFFSCTLFIVVRIYPLCKTVLWLRRCTV